MTLKLSQDRKVSPFSRLNSYKGGQIWKPFIKNSFGLPAGISCPGMTSQCEKICYARKAEKMYPTAGRMLMGNWDQLQALGDDVDGIEELLQESISGYRAEVTKYSKKYERDIPLQFRIHWDGDFYSIPYADAWARVVESNPDIQFWTYTRSFDDPVNVVPVIGGFPNLAVYLSVDKDNQHIAEEVLNDNPGVFAAYMHSTFDEAQEQMVAIRGRRAPKCPENSRRVPLVTNDGVGACIECGLCVLGRRDVLFSTSHK